MYTVTVLNEKNVVLAVFARIRASSKAAAIETVKNARSYLAQVKYIAN